MTTDRISPEELNRRLSDLSIPEKDLARYFLLDEERSRAFHPALQLNPETVALPSDASAVRARSEAAMTFANHISRMRRRFRFERMIADGYAGPVIVSEGDSWFQYPILLDDTIDHLYEQGLAVRSLGAAGDTLENILREREYVDTIRETNATVFLLSAGGNDALGGGNLRAHLRDFDAVLPPASHLLPSFAQLLDHTLAMYEQVLRDVQTLPKVVTLCHGYDKVIPNNGKWLGQPMSSRGITDSAFQRAIAEHMINTFNERLQQLLLRFGSAAVYVDARGAVGATLGDWHDELHPRDAGYGRVAARFAQAIEQAASRQASATRALTRPAAHPRRAWSLHLGLNRIDPAHYGDDGRLFACHFDAEDMATIARQQGFQRTEVLLDQKATRDTVKSWLAEAAAELSAGDTLLFTYAGHGSQIPDFNSDEDDGADETLCLYDGMLIDDELYELWSRFGDDVRVVMVSDSCHSGTVSRGARREAQSDSAAADDARPRSRLLPREVATRTFRTHRQFYRELGGQRTGPDDRLLTRELAMPLRCTVLLLSGCQDNQESQDGVGNGRFTQELLTVWDEGRFVGDWKRLHRRIVANMPGTQTPNLKLIGCSPEAFAAMPPFTA